jgi:hypothetical protein
MGKGKKRETRSVKRAESKNSVFAVLWFEEELGHKLVLGVRIHGKGFRYG